MSWAWPWCFLALPLPWLLRRRLAPAATGAALRLPSLPPAIPNISAAAGDRRPLWLAGFAWLLLVAAAARPQIADESAPLPASGRELMLAFDVSASMAAADLLLDGQRVERLHAARAFADRFLQGRRGDQVGLIVFGSQAYLHTPLTFDLEALRAALASVEVGLAGRDTALGDAIALAAKHMQDRPARERVLVLVSDGAHTAGSLAPGRAAWLARRAGLRIHAVGIGADPDETTLREVATQSGGSYRRATDGAAMAAFWQALAAAEAAGPAAAAVRPRELYLWPLALALALAAGLAWSRGRRGR